jgi:glycosyltransferase involved in cell wall biosynthesis
MRIVGTAAHKTAPTYGAENFELFVGRAVFDRRSFFRNEQEYPLQILSEADLDLSYEANFPDVNASVRGRELGRYLANVPFDPMRNANWLYGHLLNNPYWHSAYDYNVLLIGPDKWVIAGQRHRDAAFLFDVKLQDVFRFLHQIEANTRVVFHLHPVYFAETGAESRIEPSRTARPHLGQWFAQVQKEVADNHAQILSRLEQAEGRMFGELGTLEARAGLELESLRDGMNSRLDQIFTRVSQYPGYRLVNFVRVNAKRLLKLGYLAFLCLGAVMPKPRRPRQQGKRILMLTISQIDIDSRINKEARSLAREGYSVDIFCLQHQRYESSLVEEQVMPGVRYIRILTQWKEANLFFQEAFRRAALVRDYDYVHAHDLTTLLTGWLIARKKGVPLIYDAHEMWSENVVWKGGEYRGMPFYVRLLARMWEGFLVRYVDLLITVSPSIVQAFRQRYRLKSDPLLLANYVELGIDLSADYPAPGIRELCGLGDDAFVTLYLGGINQVRNIENVIEAHRMLPENAVFVIRGPSIEYFEEQYLELARGLGLQGRVFCLPPVGRDEVIAGARGADCGVILLRNLCRNFYWYYPNKFFEYMLAGIPVIASNFPDVTAHLERERSGLVCDPESPEAIAETIRRLYEHREEAREMGRRGRASIYRQYNWEEAIKELLERYRRLYGFKS